MSKLGSDLARSIASGPTEIRTGRVYSINAGVREATARIGGSSSVARLRVASQALVDDISRLLGAGIKPSVRIQNNTIIHVEQALDRQAPSVGLATMFPWYLPGTFPSGDRQGPIYFAEYPMQVRHIMANVKNPPSGTFSFEFRVSADLTNWIAIGNGALSIAPGQRILTDPNLVTLAMIDANHYISLAIFSGGGATDATIQLMMVYPN